MIRVGLVAAVLTFAGATDGWCQHMRPADVNALPVSAPTLVAHYGPDRWELGELRVPRGKGPFPIAVVIHGGCWTKGFAQMRNTSALADALTEDGIATWNIDYRQVGNAGGGWPGTFRDWAAGADYVRVLAKTWPLDLRRVIAVGHSAGAHAALWLAARGKLARSSAVGGGNPLRIVAAVGIDGPGDLAGFVGNDAEICGKPVIVPFMGGTPAQVPDRYRQASPVELLPLHVPQYLVASVVLTADEAEAYRAKAVAGGDRVRVLDVVNGGHFDIIAPKTKPGREVKAFVESALTGAGQP